MKKNAQKQTVLDTISGSDAGSTLEQIIGEKTDIAGVFAELSRLLREKKIVYQGQHFHLKEKTPKEEFKDSFNDLDRVLQKYSLPAEFPRPVLDQARRCGEAGKRELPKRKKLDEWIITIDSESAKDLDDAVSVRQVRNGWELGVHIADVSFYVPRGSLLDKDAFARGTSVYLNRHVVPMFPHELSDDLCSLNANSQKLALSAFLSIDTTGKVTAARFEKTVIQVARRFSYNEVEAILRGKKDADAHHLKVMADLAKILRIRRHEQGGLEFEVPEVRTSLDDSGDAVGVTVPVRNEAEMMIEDFMLAANEQVASFLSKKGASIFRIHASPDQEKLQEFVKFARGIGLGLRVPADNTPRAMQHLLEEVRSNPNAGVLSSLLLRTMQKAVYSTDNPGHFGLAFADYTHFTSPIRRYPDLVVHRLLSAAIEGKKAYTQKELERIAEQATKMEQNAVDAEREYTRIKGARFLGKKIGETFEGKVTSVTSWGMFITLLQWGLDGLLHISELRDDYYRLDTWGHTLVGERTRRVYSIGSIIKVKIKSVNAEKGFVDLVLEESKQAGSKKGESSRNRQSGQNTRERTRSTEKGSGSGQKNAQVSRPGDPNEQKGPMERQANRNRSRGRSAGPVSPVEKSAKFRENPLAQPEQAKSGANAETGKKKGWLFWKK